jgi:4,5-DOPA dioxygenase extradiol
MSERLPPIFLSHGSPTVLIDDDAAHRFFIQWAEGRPRPREILMVSAHWETSIPTVSTVPHPETIHDFGGFPPALYEVHYPAPGAPDLAERTASLLTDAGFGAARNPDRGLDHGAWVPLKLMYPDADIPVTQLSVQTRLGAAHHYQMGRALAPLVDEGVWVVASGSATHNLQAIFDGGFDHDAPVPTWVSTFADWLAETLTAGRVDDVLNYRALAPFARENHPTEEHVLPLFVALGAAGGGAGGEKVKAERLHASYTFGALAMDAYGFS